MQNNKCIETLLYDILKSQQEIKEWLNSQDKQVDDLKIQIENLKNQGKYTAKQIVAGLAIILPILGYCKDLIRLLLVGT